MLNLLKINVFTVCRDNPDTDIYGGNLYKEYIKNSHTNTIQNLPNTTINGITSILVSTGVHSKGNLKTLVEMPHHIHKDIQFKPNMRTPDYNVENITDAIRLIMENEQL